MKVGYVKFLQFLLFFYYFFFVWFIFNFFFLSYFLEVKCKIAPCGLQTLFFAPWIFHFYHRWYLWYGKRWKCYLRQFFHSKLTSNHIILQVSAYRHDTCSRAHLNVRKTCTSTSPLKRETKMANFQKKKKKSKYFWFRQYHFSQLPIISNPNSSKFVFLPQNSFVPSRPAQSPPKASSSILAGFVVGGLEVDLQLDFLGTHSPNPLLEPTHPTFSESTRDRVPAKDTRYFWDLKVIFHDALCELSLWYAEEPYPRSFIYIFCLGVGC